jgi:large subunit ribosomal protein L17
MRHRKAGVKLNRTSSHRKAMFRNMVTSLFKYERIRTTDAKAKELRRLADNMVTLAKRGDLHARRQATAFIREKAVVHKLFEDANEKFGSINGGYTRVIKLGRRPGDAAPISIVELVSIEPEKKKKKKKKAETVTETPKTDIKADEPSPEVTASTQTVEEEAAPVSVSDEEIHADVAEEDVKENGDSRKSETAEAEEPEEK